MNFRSIVAVALAAALTGCLGGDAPAADDADGASPAATNATGTDGTTPTADVEAETPPPPEPVVTDVSYDGTTGNFVCLSAPGQFQCQGSFSTTSTKQLEYTGTPQRVAGEVTWEVQSPTALELIVSVFATNGTGWDPTAVSQEVRGASPLAFDFDLAEYEGLNVFIDVSSRVDQGTGDTQAHASMQQAFQLVGNFTHLPPAQ